MTTARAARKASFADFKAQTYEFEIDSPDGDVLIVELRAMTPDERAEIDFRRNPKPQPPVMDFRVIDGSPYPVYNYEDAGYTAQFGAWVNRRMRLLIIHALVMDLPGETDDERLDALNSMAAWALDGLWRAVQMLTAVGDDAVRRHSFQPDGTGDSPAV